MNPHPPTEGELRDSRELAEKAFEAQTDGASYGDEVEATENHEGFRSPAFVLRMHAEMDRFRAENERLRRIYFDALQLCVMAGVPKKDGFSDVSMHDLERLSTSVEACDYFMTQVVQTPVRSRYEGWEGYGGSDPSDDGRRGE